MDDIRVTLDTYIDQIKKNELIYYSSILVSGLDDIQEDLKKLFENDPRFTLILQIKAKWTKLFLDRKEDKHWIGKSDLKSC